VAYVRHRRDLIAILDIWRPAAYGLGKLARLVFEFGSSLASSGSEVDFAGDVDDPSAPEKRPGLPIALIEISWLI
jgi:hypothetical protein